MRRLIAVPLLAVALVVLLPSGGAHGSPAGRGGGTTGSFGVRLVAVPGAVSDDRLARLYIIDTMVAGTSLTRSVEIVNRSHAGLDVAVYAAAATVAKGTFVFAPGRSSNELSRWTSVDQGVIHVAPEAAATDSLTITVPRTAAPGSRTAVIWAEVTAAPTGTGGVTLVNRVGVRVYVSVGSGGPVSSSFVIGPMVARRSAAGIPSVSAGVRNTSTSAFDVNGTLTLTDGPGGLSAGPFAVTAGSVISPGGSARVSVPFRSAMPRGPWRAHLVLTNGLVQRSAAAAITFPPLATGATGSGDRVLLILVAALLALVLVGVVLLELRRRRRGRDIGDHQLPTRSMHDS